MRIYLIGMQIVYMPLGVNVMLTVDLCCQLTFLDLPMLNSLAQSPAQFLKMMIPHISITVFQGTLNTHCRPTDYFPYQHYYPNSSSNAHTGIVLELLNQGATRENYITLLITANFIVEKMKENYSVHLDKVEF